MLIASRFEGLPDNEGDHKLQMKAVMSEATYWDQQRRAPRNAVEPYSFRFIGRRLANARRGLGDADLAETDTPWDQAKAEGY